MQLVEKAKGLGKEAVDALAEKRAAITESVSGVIDRGKEAAHHLVDKIAAVVHRGPASAAEPTVSAEGSSRVVKQRGEKKPRAARRRARRMSRAVH